MDRNTWGGLRALAVLALPLLLGVGRLAAITQERCDRCVGSGVLDCSRCGPRPAGLLACSAAAGCRTCRGAFEVPCPTCGAARPPDRLAIARALSQGLLTELEALRERYGLRSKDLVRCTTGHFELVFAVGKLAGCPERDAGRRARLFAVRLEALRTRLLEVLGEGGDTVSPERRFVAVVDDARDQRRLARGMTKLESQGLGNLALRDHRIVLHRSRAVATDAALHGLLAHVVSHAVADVGGAAGSDRAGWAWLDAGLAHWLEEDASGRNLVSCFRGRPQPPMLFWGGDWRTAARELLEAEDLPSLPEVMATETSDLDPARHVVAFAFVDFLKQRGGGAIPVTHDEQAAPAPSIPPLGSLVRASRRGEASAAALRRALGRDTLALDLGFRQFVRERYPRR